MVSDFSLEYIRLKLDTLLLIPWFQQSYIKSLNSFVSRMGMLTVASLRDSEEVLPWLLPSGQVFVKIKKVYG